VRVQLDLSDRKMLTGRLTNAGCVAPEEELDDLIGAADGDRERLERLVERRMTGAPLAWVTGSTGFLGHRVKVDTGVYVPRWQSEILVRKAIECLPEDGLAADLCTGSGAIAVALRLARPRARIVATEIDPSACRCAASNGVEVFEGDMADPLPNDLYGRVDLVIAVVPYVPTEAFAYLPRDVREHEPSLALDGGPDGTRLLRAAIWAGSRLLRTAGTLILELGGDQDDAITEEACLAGFGAFARIEDEEGDLRGVAALRMRRQLCR